MRKSDIIGALLGCAIATAPIIPLANAAPDQTPKIDDQQVTQAWLIVVDKFIAGKVSADATYEVFGALLEGLPEREKALKFLNLLSEHQTLSAPKIEGIRIRPKGPALRDMSLALSIPI